MNQFNVSIWGDEAFSAILSQKSIPNIILTIAKDTSPPLYNILEHICFRFFGTSEITIRALSFFFFLIAIFFVFKIASHFWTKETALFASLLTFFNPFFFQYAFEGRMYSLLAATVVASFYFLITKKWKFYVLAVVLALYTHHFAIFAIFIEGIWFLLFSETKNLKTKIILGFEVFGAIALLYTLWLIPLYNQTKMVGSGFWLGVPTLIDLKELIYKYLAKGIPNNLDSLALWLTFGILILRHWEKNIKKSLFLILWFLTPIILTWLVSQKFQSIFFDRYLLYTIPAAMILLASQKRFLSHILIVILFASFWLIDFNYFTHPTKPPFRDLAQYVLETKKGDDYLINWNSSAHHLWESKYYGIGAPIYLPDKGNLPYFTGTALMTPTDTIRALPLKANRIGVITSGPIDEIKLPGYTESKVSTFDSLKFIWYEKN